VDVARFIHDELARIGTPSVPKTSGATGMHFYIPLPPRTSYETGRIFCEIVATLVADRHPRVATVERAVDARGRRVYIDYMQNFRGKTLATAYSARGSDFAGASTPLTWREVHAGIDHRDFTLTTLPARVRRVGDLARGARGHRAAPPRSAAGRRAAGRTRRAAASAGGYRGASRLSAAGYRGASRLRRDATSAGGYRGASRLSAAGYRGASRL